MARRTIKDWPRADRPRDKLLDRGPSALSDAELLAIAPGYPVFRITMTGS